MRFCQVNGVGLVSALLFSLAMVSVSVVLVEDVPPRSLPACRARRLPLEGILIACDLHQTNIPLICSFCLKGEIANEVLGWSTPRWTESKSGQITDEFCEYTYFPKLTGTYTFSVGITKVSQPVVTNDLVISELPRLNLQKTCQDGLLRVTCTGTWYLATPLVRIVRVGRESGEISIRSGLAAGLDDTYVTEAVMWVGKEEQTGYVNVTCEAVYKVQTHFRHITNSIGLNFNAPRPAVKVSLLSIGDSVVQCTADIPHTNLSLHCTNIPDSAVYWLYGESPLSFNISDIGNSRSVMCECAENLTDKCHGDAEANLVLPHAPTDNSLESGARVITPIIRDSHGLPVVRTYEINAGTVASFECFAEINEIYKHRLTVKCLKQDGELILVDFRESMPLKFDLRGNVSYNQSICLCQIRSTSDDLWSPTTVFIVSVKGHQPSTPVIVGYENASQDGASGRDSVDYGNFIVVGVFLFAFSSLVTSVIVYVYLYWREQRRNNASRSSSASAQSNDYASVNHSPQSSKSSSAPSETCALLVCSCPPDSSGDSGSGASSSSNQYFNDSPDDIETRSYDQIQNTHSMGLRNM